MERKTTIHITTGKVIKEFGVKTRIARKAVEMRCALSETEHGFVTRDDIHYFGNCPYKRIPDKVVEF